MKHSKENKVNKKIMITLSFLLISVSVSAVEILPKRLQIAKDLICSRINTTYLVTLKNERISPQFKKHIVGKDLERDQQVLKSLKSDFPGAEYVKTQMLDSVANIQANLQNSNFDLVANSISEYSDMLGCNI